MPVILKETNGYKHVQNDNGSFEEFIYEVKNGTKVLAEQRSFDKENKIQTERVFNGDKQVLQRDYGRTPEGTPILKMTTSFDKTGTPHSVLNPEYAQLLARQAGHPKAHPQEQQDTEFHVHMDLTSASKQAQRMAKKSTLKNTLRMATPNAIFNRLFKSGKQESH